MTIDKDQRDAILARLQSPDPICARCGKKRSRHGLHVPYPAHELVVADNEQLGLKVVCEGFTYQGA